MLVRSRVARACVHRRSRGVHADSQGTSLVFVGPVHILHVYTGWGDQVRVHNTLFCECVHSQATDVCVHSAAAHVCLRRQATSVCVHSAAASVCVHSAAVSVCVHSAAASVGVHAQAISGEAGQVDLNSHAYVSELAHWRRTEA